MRSDLSMSDCRLGHEEGFVEDEVEVWEEEFTLRGGQESYRGRISVTIVAQRRSKKKAYAIAIVATHRVSLLEWDG